MNIWIFNHYAVGPNSSGITRHFDLAKEIVKLGHNVTIFAASFNHQKRIEEQSFDQNEYIIEKFYEGVKFCWIKTPPYQGNDLNRVKNIIAYTTKLNRILKKQNEMPDVIIGSLMHPLAAVMGYKAAKSLSAKFYFEERDLWPQSLIDLGKVSPKNPLVKALSALELFLYRKSDKIIVLFDKAPNYVTSRGIKREKVLYLPNGVDISRYREGNLPIYTPEINKAFAKHKDKFLIVYTGAHSVANYLEAVLKVAKEVGNQSDDVHFLFIGDGPDKNNLINMAEKDKITNVTFLPVVQKEEIPAILQRANAGIIALRDVEVYKWGISLNKMYDYMAAGLPIIMYTTLKDTVVEENNLGVVSDNIKELSTRIIEMSESEAINKEIKDRSIKYVRENHTWDKLAQKFLQSIGSEANVK